MPTLAPRRRVSRRPYVLPLGLLLLAWLLSPGLVAQPTAPTKLAREFPPEIKAFFTPKNKARMAYYNATIMPAMLHQRRLLEQELTAVDRQLLLHYHAQSNKLRADYEARQRLLPAVLPGQPNPEYAAYVRQQMALFNPADSLARKYVKAIDRHLQGLAPQVAQWQDSLRAIEVKYADSPPTNPPGRIDLRSALNPVDFLLVTVLTEAQVQERKRVNHK